jgi:hypothetical protein
MQRVERAAPLDELRDAEDQVARVRVLFRFTVDGDLYRKDFPDP